jgi:tryptophan synthase alpha chain
LPAGLADRVRWLQTQADVPVLVGFGISGPEQVRAVAAVADGAIVGSALVRLVAESTEKPRNEMLAAVAGRVADLVAACDPAT